MPASSVNTFSAFGQAALREAATAATVTFYDEPEAWAAFSQDVNNHEVQSFVAVRGMHCAACALVLEAALRSVKGVATVQVSAASASASVTWAVALTRPSIWMQAALAKGYELLPSEDASSMVNNRQQSRLALWRWLP